jgi:asparagine synthase (glutamine-hydrolysing)
MVLTGDGGDELFGGYDRYLRLMTLEQLGLLGRPAAAALRVAGALLPDPLGGRLDRIGERLQLPREQRYLSGVALMRADTARALHPDAGGARHYHLPCLDEADADLGAGGSSLDRAVAIDLQSYLPDDILVKLDRMAMANSLEGRSPFLHPRLAEFALSLPESFRLRRGRGKFLLRRVAERWLPSRPLSKPKQGFAIPLAQWFRGPLREMARDTFTSRTFRERGLCDARAARALLDEHASGRADRREALWQVICLELWAQHFLDATPAAGS